MSDNDFIRQAAIAAMQGILSNPDMTNTFNINAENQAIRHAESLLLELKKREYSTEENDINQYIMDVDETHGKNEIELQKRIEALEYIVENLKQIIENNFPGWVNKS